VRITFILPDAGMAGGIRVVAEYAQELVLMGHKVLLVSQPAAPAPIWQKLKSWSQKKLGPVDRIGFKSHLDGRGLDHKVLERSRPVIDADVPDADVVIATWWETAEWVNALGPEKGAKVYFIQHHEVFSYLPVERSRATYELPLHKIVISRWLKQAMELEYRDFVVDLVPNSIDRLQFFAPFRRKQAIPTVGFLYSSVPFKGLDVSLAALKLVRMRLPAMRIVSFGNERLRAHLPLPEGTDFFFSPPQDKIRHVYDQCDVWVTASRSEGFNLPAMEAMACRTPVVSTRTGWPEEVIKSGWNGFLVDIDSVDALAEGIEWVLTQDNEKWEIVSSNAFDTVSNSSWQASSKLFEGALLHACRRAERGEIAGRPGYSSCD
jgi:glycosyltransferase involved in cell wall biosynthesis